jgi:hypothetical protein
MSGVRLTREFRAEIKAWAAEQEDKPTLAEAIRRLTKIGLRRRK